MSDKKTRKPTEEVKSEAEPEILETEELDDAHGGAILDTTRIKVGSSFNTVYGGNIADTIYGGIGSFNDLPIRRGK